MYQLLPLHCIFTAYVGAAFTFTEMHLLPEPLFSIPTDNTQFGSIEGAANGRIFMAGKDGCLYELLYQVYFLSEKVMPYP